MDWCKFVLAPVTAVDVVAGALGLVLEHSWTRSGRTVAVVDTPGLESEHTPSQYVVVQRIPY